MDVLTSFIIDVNIIHENKNIRSLVLKELNNKGIKKYSLAYSDSKLEQIKKEIIKDNPNTLEWINITRSGMKYIVRIEERIIKEDQNDNSYRHVVATKEGQITKILSSKGEILVRQGDYVKKGDILISGSINLYDEIKGNTAATGTVYANVWYEATIKMPKKETITKPTGKKRYNLNINNKILLKNKKGPQELFTAACYNVQMMEVSKYEKNVLRNGPAKISGMDLVCSVSAFLLWPVDEHAEFIICRRV